MDGYKYIQNNFVVNSKQLYTLDDLENAACHMSCLLLISYDMSRQNKFIHNLINALIINKFCLNLLIKW